MSPLAGVGAEVANRRTFAYDGCRHFDCASPLSLATRNQIDRTSQYAAAMNAMNTDAHQP